MRKKTLSELNQDIQRKNQELNDLIESSFSLFPTPYEEISLRDPIDELFSCTHQEFLNINGQIVCANCFEEFEIHDCEL